MAGTCTWEEAVQWLRDQPDCTELARHCFYDDPIDAAARRFQKTTEWRATLDILGARLPCDVLDLGAGRGIASYAFASEGSRVTALEPDDSPLVGRGAIADLCRRTGVEIRCAAGYGEGLPFPSGSFDVVYGRAVLHHAQDLTSLMHEVARVLRPCGLAFFVREHVISRAEDLPRFLEGHALHRLYGGEHAYLLSEYQSAFHASGLRLRSVLGPWDSPVNYWPSTADEVEQSISQPLRRRLGRRLSAWLLHNRWFYRNYRARVSRFNDEPGRLFAFLGAKE